MQYNSIYSNTADTASVFSDAELSSEAAGELKMPRGMPSSKAQCLAGEIAEIEHRNIWLEERNQWLTARLMANRKRFIEQNWLRSQSGLLSRSLDAWREAMAQLRVEGQLEKQTAALDQCQQVARELGAALAQEQGGRKRAEDVARTLQAELERLLAFNEGLQRQSEDSVKRENVLSKRLEEAENRLRSCRQDAQSIIDNVDLWDERKTSIEAKTIRQTAREDEDFFGRSEQIRSEAREVMEKVSGLLPSAATATSATASRRSTPSPERERPDVGGRNGTAFSVVTNRSSPSRSPSRSYGGTAAKRTSSERARAVASDPTLRAVTSEALELGGAGVAASVPLGGRFGAWKYDPATVPLDAMSVDYTQAGTPSVGFSYETRAATPPQDGRPRILSGNSLLPATVAPPPRLVGSPVVAGRNLVPASAGGSPTSATGGSQGQVLEPWWCVRRTNPNGTTTVTPQQAAPSVGV